MTPSEPHLLAGEGISKYYGNVVALRDISLHVDAGEVTCILGDNGAGKSSLIQILSGVHQQDGGRLLVDGDEVSFASPRHARSHGIATVYQDLAMVPLMSIWRNFFLGAEPIRGAWPLRRIDVEEARETTVRAMARVGVTGLDPDQPASTLEAGARQSLAIARALHFGSRALVVDEPTAPLTVAHQTLLLQAIVAARSEGLAVLLVTNNPRYAHLVGDRFVLLAGGQIAGNLTRDDIDAADLTRLIAGGDELTAITAALSAAHPELGERWELGAG
jgi:simple sugar transport system ATP-binding protein